VDYRVHLGTRLLPLVSGWREGLQVAVGNLLDNAAVHGAHVVEVDVSTVDVSTTASDTVSISVSDDGFGIPAESRAAMKQRFVRGPQAAANGSGLGLALVDQQAALHGGVFELGESTSGGLRATIVLR
jgi:two-component system sensor histidine kinase PrrB